MKSSPRSLESSPFSVAAHVVSRGATRTLLVAVTFAAAAACYGTGSGGGTSISPGGSDAGGTGGGTGGTGGTGGAGGGSSDGGTTGTGGGPGTGGTTTVGDLPCDIATILVTKCQSCHGSPLAGSAPMPLRNHADLVAASSGYPGQTYADRSLVRMQNTSIPMPPKPAAAVTAADIATFSAWVTAGEPATGCTVSTGSDGGVTPPAPVDAGPPPAPVCTSGVTGTKSDNGMMRPGEACVSCHQSSGGPGYNFAGTIYPTLSEPNDCNGASTAGVQVIIIDSKGTQTTLTPNSAGNFYKSISGVSLPYTVKVVSGANSISMTTPQTSGDCNSCHTVTGANGAPGRVLVP